MSNDAQPTPRTFELRCKDYDVSSPQALMEVITDILESHEELERTLAQKDAELTAAKSETCVHSVTDPTCLACTKRNLEAERTAREQDNNWSARENSQLGEELANAKQRLAAVEAQLAGVVEQCAKVCEEAVAEIEAANPTFDKLIAHGHKIGIDVAMNMADRIRALTAAPKE